MTQLEKIIANWIVLHGPMDMATYMELCLAHPEHGYYRNRDPFGRCGDFITAPEISQIFGELIGAFFADLWLRAGRPEKVTLLECGPGRGTLMADLLRATENLNGFHKALEIILLETSPVLMDKQKAMLGACQVKWICDISELEDQNAPLFLLANEFFDALPVRQYEKTGKGWFERALSLNDGGKLELGLMPVAGQSIFPAGLSNGAIYELSPARYNFAHQIFAQIKKRGGAGLIIDYGYSNGHGNSLQAVQKHRKVSILHEPGESDLTAHVDFQALGEAAKAQNLRISPVIGQGQFLKNLGLEQRCRILCSKGSAEQQKDMKAGCERLTAKDQMGDLFKVLCVYTGQFIPEGFQP